VFSDPNICCISELSNNSVISDSSTAINNILSSSLSISLILSASLTGFSVLSEEIYFKIPETRRPPLTKSSILVGADGNPLVELGTAIFYIVRNCRV
jgi:hypothetical protein